MEREIINEFLTKYNCKGIVWYTIRLDNGKYISTQTPDNISENEMNAQFNTPEAALCKNHTKISKIRTNCEQTTFKTHVENVNITYHLQI